MGQVRAVRSSNKSAQCMLGGNGAVMEEQVRIKRSETDDSVDDGHV